MFDTLKRPQRANDFAVRVRDPDWEARWVDILSAQTTKLRLNLVRKQVVLSVRQLRAGIIQDIIVHTLARSDGAGMIDELTIRPASKNSYEFVFTKGLIFDHDCVYDVKSNDVIVHDLYLQFENLSMESARMGEKIYLPKT